MKRGYRERPLLDEDGEPTTRAKLLQSERGGYDQWELAEDLGWLLPTNRPVPIDPALVDQVVALQEKRAS